MPQLCLQSFYLFTLNEVNAIAVSSMIVSIISIIVSVLSMTMDKSLYNTQKQEIITMDIIGEPIMQNLKRCKRRNQGIRDELAVLLRTERSHLEIVRPVSISNGISMEIHVYINNMDIDIEKTINDANDNGKLGEIMKIGWKLSHVPVIDNIKTVIVKSKQESKLVTNTKVMHVTSESGWSGDDENEQIAKDIDLDGVTMVNLARNDVDIAS